MPSRRRCEGSTPAGSGDGERLGTALRDLYDLNVGYTEHEDMAQDASQREIEYQRWSDQVGRRIAEVTELIARLRES